MKCQSCLICLVELTDWSLASVKIAYKNDFQMQTLASISDDFPVQVNNGPGYGLVPSGTKP